MSERTIIACDECGKEKGAENHWFSAELATNEFRIAPYGEARFSPRHDLCGRECAQKALERYLATGTIYPRPDAVAEIPEGE